MKNKSRRVWLALTLLLCALTLCSCGKNNSSAYEKALKLFSNGDYAEAAAAFGELGDYAQAQTYAAYSQGLVFYEQGQYSAAEPYFANARGFMYGEERYQFCHAVALEENGSYAEAMQIFEGLGEFENAALHYQYCRACAAEIDKDYATALFAFEAAIPLNDAEDRLYGLRGQIYNRAIACRESGDYESAIVLFTMLGDYLSSADQAVECKDLYREDQYNQADALESQGSLQAAYDLFNSLTGYRDAAQRAETLAAQLGIEISADN